MKRGGERRVKNASPAKDIVRWDFDKIFYPTLDLYLLSGKNAITDFRDRARADDAEQRNKHAVLITHSDINALSKQTSNYAFAKEAAAYIFEHQKRVPGGQEQPINLGDNLFLIVTPDEQLEDVRARRPEIFAGDKPKLEVVCLNEGDAILYHERGFKSGISQFDKVNTAIRREGVKTITDDSLYAEVMQQVQSERAQHHGKEHRTVLGLDMVKDKITRIFPNQYIVLQTEAGGAPIVGYVRGEMEYNHDRTRMVMDEAGLELHIMHDDEIHGVNELGIKPKDLNQALYMHAMRQPHISRIFVTGGPSSGKTLVGYASALAQTLHRQRGKLSGHDVEDEKLDAFTSRFRKIFITKPLNELMGGARREIGFLPGTEQEKIWGQIQSYVDAHGELSLQMTFEELAFGMDQRDNTNPNAAVKNVYQNLWAPRRGGLIEVQDYNKWLGRTINRSVIFADEAQNLDPFEFQAINTRTGHGCLVIFSGDYEGQVYNRSLSTIDNGLFQGLQFYMGRPYVSIINLEGAYRDQAAEDAASMHVQRRPDKR